MHVGCNIESLGKGFWVACLLKVGGAILTHRKVAQEIDDYSFHF